MPQLQFTSMKMAGLSENGKILKQHQQKLAKILMMPKNVKLLSQELLK